MRRRPASALSKELGGRGRGGVRKRVGGGQEGKRKEEREGDEEGKGVEVRRWRLREVGGERTVQRDG